MNVVFFVVLFGLLQFAVQRLLVGVVPIKVQFEETKLFRLLEKFFHELVIAMLTSLELLDNLRENLNVVLAFVRLLLHSTHLIKQLVGISLQPVTQLGHPV